MFGLGIPELMIILVIIVVIFGASRLPEIGSGIGKGIKNFKKSIKGEDEIDVSPKEEEKTPKEEEKKESEEIDSKKNT